MVGGRGDAETHLTRALEIAQAQQARLFELRAARSLASLWFNQGRVQEARAVVTPICDWFTEGFDMPDLLEAAKMVVQSLTDLLRVPRSSALTDEDRAKGIDE